MQKIIITITSLLLSIGLLLFGHGLLGTLLALRGVSEGFQESTIGLFMTMYYLGYISGTFICPKIIRRVGHIRTLATLAAILSVTAIAMGLWVDVYTWSVARFISGSCIVGSYMVIESWMNSQASNSNRGLVMGFYQLISLGFLAAGQFLLLAGDIDTLDLFAIASVLITLSLIPVALTRLPEPGAIHEIKIGLYQLYRTSPLGFMGCFISGLMGGAFWGLGPLFARQENFTDFGIALFMSTTILGGMLLQLPIGWWSDRYDRRNAIMLIAVLISLIALIALFIPRGEPVLLAICMFFFGGMLFTIYPVSVAHTNDHPGDFDRVAITINLLLTYGIGASIGPLLAGYFMKSYGHYFMLIYFIISGSALAIFAAWRSRRGVEIPVETQVNFVPHARTSQVMAETVAETAEITGMANESTTQDPL